MKKKQRADARSAMCKVVKLMFALTLLLLSSVQAKATSTILSQTERTISGLVKDDSGEPVIGAAVVVKGTTIGTTTDIDGLFTLKIPANAGTLQVTYMGMKTMELPIGDKTQFNVVMEPDYVLIDDVVVIGYGTCSKKDMSIAVSSVKSEELNDRPSAFNIMQSVAGKVAGVTNVSMSGRPGGSSVLRVRGMGSINAGKDPIYVLDGVIGVDPDIINSANVESIDVLKDAAATAMYGAQGSNGVVLITTKKGKNGKGTVTYDGKMRFGFMGRKLDMLNADEYMEVQRRSYAYSEQTMPHLLTADEKLFYYAKDASGNYQYDENGLLIASPKYNTDWQKEITRTAITNDHIVSFASGTDNTSVYASVAYQNYEGAMKGSEYERFSGTVNVNSRIKEWLRVQVVGTVGSQKGNNNDMESHFGQGPSVV
ncbi:MAG: SusC/RagA family TonB-linked outer membrane protein [Bacteroides sp.]|nr:SusC/RagA family TonB-linked outer membrane protein [Bacteroides sp.]